MKKKKVTFKDVVKSSKPTLVDFYATWCGPCQAMMPAIKEVSQRVGDSAKVIKIDIDRNQKLANKLNIRSCLLYTSPSPRDRTRSRMPSSA